MLTGYAVTNTVTATFRDVSTAGAAIDAVVGALGNTVQINGLTFSFANPAQVEDQARADAVHQAVAHAGAMAAAAGRRLGPVCSLTDDTQPDFVEPNSDLNYAQAGVAKGAAVPVEPGMQSETDQVTLVYTFKSTLSASGTPAELGWTGMPPAAESYTGRKAKSRNVRLPAIDWAIS